ncbi:MAG TPA: regulatory protein RecX [Gammaproteobacteria bacterium]
MLARREHSKHELINKLRVRNYPDNIIFQTVDQLAAAGMQSDARFAESFVRSKVDRGRGPLRIRAGLMERGIEDGIIDEALLQYEDGWRDLALEVYNKRYRGHEPPRNIQERARRSGFLQQRGFTSAQIRYAIEQKHALKQIEIES